MSEFISMFPFDEQPIEIRQELTVLFRKSRWGQIGRTPGIKVIESSRAYESNIDCAAYALGLIGEPLLDKWIELSLSLEVDQICSGDIIYYYGPNSIIRRSPKHTGIMIDNQTVLSKWNHGSVYEHPVWLVPSVFGNEVKVVRRT